MRKDIEIPQVENVYFAVIQEKHLEYDTLDWNAYIINDSDIDLDTVLIVSKGYDSQKVTPVFRHQISNLPSKSFAKVEYMQDQVLALNNEFKVTFFSGTKMYEKTYLFEKNSINTRAMQNIPLMHLNGVLRK